MKTCADFYEQIEFDPPEPFVFTIRNGKGKGQTVTMPPERNWSASCCQTCHEDVDYGFPLPVMYDGNKEVGAVCCRVSRALEAEGRDEVQG